VIGNQYIVSLAAELNRLSNQ